MAGGRLTSVQLTQFYLDRIAALDQAGPNVNSVIELNPDALQLAQDADNRRAKGKVIGPLDGIPVLLKDNIDTGDKMQTTAGSFALAGKPALHDSTVAANLRAGGAVILGKTNLSEWANFRSFFSSSGWSGRGGLTHNPYSIDRNACGSSSGSAAARRRDAAGHRQRAAAGGGRVRQRGGRDPDRGRDGRGSRQRGLRVRLGGRGVPGPAVRLQARRAEVLRHPRGRSDGEQDARR